MMKEFVFGVTGASTSLTVGWLALATPHHSAGLFGCQAHGAAVGPIHRALIQPTTGSPLYPFFSLSATTSSPHVCTP